MGIFSIYQKFRSLSKWVRLSLIVSLLQILFICTLETLILFGVIYDLEHINILIKSFNERSISDVSHTSYTYDSVKQSLIKYQALPVYFTLFLFAQFFQFALCCDAARTQNTIQILVLALFNFLLLLYAFVQLFQTLVAHRYFMDLAQTFNIPFEPSPFNLALEFTIIGVLLVFAICFAVIACKLYREYGWNIYKRIGADLQMRRRFTIYHIFVMVLKFDILLFISFSTQYICLVIVPTAGFEWDFYIHLIASVAICVIMSVLAFWSVKKESYHGILLFALGSMGVMAYFIYKLALINWPCVAPNCVTDRFLSSRIFLTVFTSFCILFSMLTILGSILCYGNFGKGLKHILNDPTARASPDNRSRLKVSRWSLD